MKKLGGVYSSHRVHVRSGKPDFDGAYGRFHWHRDHGLLEYGGGETPLQELQAKRLKERRMHSLGRLNNLHQYNKIVLAKTPTSIVTMFWSGMQCFLTEEFSNGTCRVSYATTDREYMKQLYQRNKVIWRDDP